MKYIDCWARKIIIERLRELHHSIRALQSIPPVAMKRLVCSYLGDDIQAMLEKVCALEKEVIDDEIVTPELETYIIEFLSDLTRHEPFDERSHRRNWEHYYHHHFGSDYYYR